MQYSKPEEATWNSQNGFEVRVKKHEYWSQLCYIQVKGP